MAARGQMTVTRWPVILRDNECLMRTTGTPPSRPVPLLWDIFCAVIDNHGDLGVCWRLAVNLAARGQRVRLWIDRMEDLQWLAPHGHDHVEIRHWQRPMPAAALPAPGDVLVEAFGCHLDESIQQWWANARGHQRRTPWLNLEYLTAEDYAGRNHLLHSPVMQGPASGMEKQFFYPGFAPSTGGLLREPDLLERQQRFDRKAFLHFIHARTDLPLTVSLFCYEPAGLHDLLQQLRLRDCQLLVTPGRSQAALQVALEQSLLPAECGKCRLLTLPWLPQPAFDALLWSSDFNAIRGEDSLVRALWAGKPFVWHIYPQHDNAHHAKLEAFLDWLQAPPDWRQFHFAWNGLTNAPLPELTPQRLASWSDATMQARARLLMQPDLASQLMDSVRPHLQAAMP